VRILTIAPELDGALDVARMLSDHGVRVSAGHTGADFEVASRALDGPWTAVTHLFNQMTPFHHRDPGMVGAALLSDRSCGLIVDGIHSDPAAVRLAWEVLGPARLLLVTDAIEATGLGEGTYRLGDLEVTVGPTGPRVNPETLAGSTLTMDRALSNLVKWTGAAVGDAVLTATRNPARLIGVEDRGSLEVGHRADLVELDEGLRVLRTYIAGQMVYEAGQ
jgi:N-acetylglucosamine-6-phosphate deacetylase